MILIKPNYVCTVQAIIAQYNVLLYDIISIPLSLVSEQFAPSPQKAQTNTQRKYSHVVNIITQKHMSIQVEILDLFLEKDQYWKMYDNFVYFFTFSPSDNKKAGVRKAHQRF
ncbi:MAG: hypothetical protein HPY87_09840 [Fervidobacterium sp.]|uniref:hypothetical protein n=1 Tax=Fervidobacterium sp. TaxID=1871331 RepID=UPI0025B83C33|nr:hypothetical protein [Fervidobacterium sp.]NPU90159.1 hypothetical protein [Fervidobacterium sp.]